MIRGIKVSLHEARVTYETIKTWALEAYFDFCRDRGLVLKMTHLEVVGYVDDDFEMTFERPIERLMLKVVILSGGWYELIEKNTRQIIDLIIAEHSLDELLVEVPEEEAAEFQHDLKLLKLI